MDVDEMEGVGASLEQEIGVESGEESVAAPKKSAAKGGKRSHTSVDISSGEGGSFKNLPFETLVKIFVTKLPQNWKSPWRKPSQKRCTGTGFILPGRLVVTNAHVVNNAISIRCRQHGETLKARARVILQSHDSDLALLEVVDQNFWQNSGGASVDLRQDLPQLGEAITVVGYPLGDHASVTKGVVSRCVLYSYINIQIDAALNPGNSGGPAFDSKGRCVGVARAHTINAQLMCYIIPIPVLSLLLKDFKETGIYTGMPDLGLRAQTLEGSALRRRLGLKDSKYKGLGVRITRMLPHRAGTSNPLQINDVIVSIAGKDVGQDGTVILRGSERIGFYHVVRSLRVGDKLNLGLVRDRGETIHTQIDLQRNIKKIPEEHDVNGCPPSGPQYCVFAGAVFVPLSLNWMKTVKMSIKSHPLLDAAIDFQDGLDEQHIMLSHILSHDCNFGYHNWTKKLVSEVNGVKLRNMRHFAELLGALRKEALQRTPLDQGSSESAEHESEEQDPLELNVVFASGYRMVLDCKEGLAAEKEICGQHAIGSIFSADLQEFL